MFRGNPTNILKIISQKAKYEYCQRLKTQMKEKFVEFTFIQSRLKWTDEKNEIGW